MEVVHFLYQRVQLCVISRDKFSIAASQLKQSDWHCDINNDDIFFIWPANDTWLLFSDSD